MYKMLIDGGILEYIYANNIQELTAIRKLGYTHTISAVFLISLRDEMDNKIILHRILQMDDSIQ